MMKVRNTNKLWTVREVADYFRRSEKTIYRWIDAGEVFKKEKIIRVRDGYLIPETEIKRILKGGEGATN